MEFVCHGKFPHTQPQQQRKKKLWKWTENTSGAMGSRRERLPSETKRREEEKNNQKQNGWLSCVGNIIEMDLFSLSLSVIYLFFFIVHSVENRREKEEKKMC